MEPSVNFFPSVMDESVFIYHSTDIALANLFAKNPRSLRGLSGEHVIADPFDDRSFFAPFGGGGFGIIVIQRPIGGIISL